LEKLGERLSTTTITTVTTMSGSTINLVRGDTTTITIEGLGDISDRTKLWLTVKRKTTDTDAQSILQVLKSNPADATTDGLLYLNGNNTTKSYANISVDNAVTGDITVTLEKQAMTELNRQSCVYDVQMLDSDGDITTLTSGRLNVLEDVTRATS
jgi:hypothetical protein